MRNLGLPSLDYCNMKVTKVSSIFALYFLCVKITDSKDLQYFSSFKFGEVFFDPAMLKLACILILDLYILYLYINLGDHQPQRGPDH